VDKPYPYIHFRQTREYDEAGVFAIGKFVMPTRVLIALVGLIFLLLIIASGAMYAVTGDSNWWGLVGWPFLGLVGVSALAGLIALVSWMIDDIKNANEENNYDGY
jgi:hypothetical protein